ncbi:MAG: amidohydrolase family protein [Planctomycetota bacterium]
MRVYADWIWDGVGDPAPGCLEIEGGCVRSVTRGVVADADRSYPKAVIVPGFVNAHAHLDLTFDPDGSELEDPFTDWLLGVKELRDEVGEAGLVDSVRRGAAEALSYGTTTIADYDPSGAAIAGLADSPLRRLILREVISFRPGTDDLFSALEEFVRGSTPNALRGIAPHAPYTVHPELWTRLIAWAVARELPWSTHIAEQPWEAALLELGEGEGADFFEQLGVDRAAFGIPGARAVELVARAGGLNPGAILVHANYVDRDEIQRIAESGAAVVYCPRSHAWFVHEEYPLEPMLRAGIPVAIGTDGKISNGRLSIIDELREVYHKSLDLPAATVMELGTRNGHRALGNRLGTGILTPGNRADFTVIPVAASTPEAVLPTLLESTDLPIATFIDGHPAWTA